jgi:hypothetical protein
MDIAVAHGTTPFVTAYPRSAGFGSKYTNPWTLPASTGWAVDFSSNWQYLAVWHDTQPLISIYPRTIWTGFGTKYSNPWTTAPWTWTRWMTFSRSGNDVFSGGFGSPYMKVYPRTSSWFGTPYADAANLPTGNRFPHRPSFWAWDTDIIIAFNGWGWAAEMRAYPRTTGTGFGTKYTDAATLWWTDCLVATFSPSGNDMVWWWNTATNLRAYPWSPGFGTAYTNPTATSGSISNAKFSTNGNDLFLTSSASPFVHAYPRSAWFGTKYSNPWTLPAGWATWLAYSATNDVAVAHVNSPFVSVYPRSAGFGTKYSDPWTAVAGDALSVSFTPLPATPAVANFFMFMT